MSKCDVNFKINKIYNRIIMSYKYLGENFPHFIGKSKPTFYLDKFINILLYLDFIHMKCKTT